MSEWFRDVAAHAGLDPDVTWKAEVCLNEAATNIIMYAYDDGARHPITIEIQPGAHTVRMTIVDDGRPFNPLDAAPPLPPRSLEDAPVGGLGIRLVRAYADDIYYERADDLNVLVLTFTAVSPSN